ncbi:WXG100 family type VII secretion target [Nocardioides perillae]|uniref:Uncharacterized protein YukE n=1 Tax=Nocardioides perillae TaxID=1119534 RepID=A0A7Y9UK99_9ACTN|nr:uncharacterized protein YukE [Nocardioides perillae]
MSGKHFTLDVDPEGLRTVAGRLGELARTFERRGTRASATPGEIDGRWQGDAATAVTAEMSALGAHLTDFGTRMGELPEALRSLARDYEEALDRLPGLNRRWEEAEQAYTDAVGAADSALSTGREEARGDDGQVSTEDRQALQRTRDDAVEAARDARHQTQYWLEYEFHHTKVHLAQRTRALGEAMRESGPLDVTDAEIEAWRNGEAPQIDRSPLFDSLVLTRQREVELVTPDVERRVEALRDALDEGDQQQVQDALDEIAAHADDPVWTEALARHLGPEGLQQLYLDIDQGLVDSTLWIEELWPSMQGFNDAVANGVSHYPDDDFAAYLETWMEQDYGPKMWALLASSDSADGRINAAALSYHSEVYNHSLSHAGGMPGLFPQVFHYAYPDTDQMEQWADRSSGDDLARIVEHASDDHLRDLLFRMHNVQTDGGTMDEDDYRLVAELWGETVQALRQRHADLAPGEPSPLPALMRFLEARNANAGSQYWDLLQPYVEDAVNDPVLMAQLLKDAASSRGGIDPSDVRKLIDDSGVDVEDVIAAVMQHQLERGDSAESVAHNIGNLLRADDIISEDFQWDKVVKSLIESGISAAAARNPVTAALSGPVMGVLNGVLDELKRMEELDQAWDDAAEENAAQQVLAFTLYVQHYGEPEGFEEFVRTHGPAYEDDASQLVTRFIDQMRDQSRAGGQTDPEWLEMERLLSAMNTARDDQ